MCDTQRRVICPVSKTCYNLLKAVVAQYDAESGATIEANGVVREFEIAVEGGLYPIPVGGSHRLRKGMFIADPFFTRDPRLLVQHCAA